MTVNVGADHKIKTGWIKENSKDFYYLSNGAPADDVFNIQVLVSFLAPMEKTNWINSKGS